MITITGIQEGHEFEAAVHLRKLILAAWPDIAQSCSDHIKMYVGLKLYGYRVEDIDLVVIGSFENYRQFDVEYKFNSEGGEQFIPRSAQVKNFLFVIEVKSHDPSGVKFDDKIASVKYTRSGRVVWEPVTEKNRTQMFEFKAYLQDRGVSKIYAQNLLFFTGLRENNFPKRPHNMFGADCSFERLLNIVGQISVPHRRDRDAYIAFGSDDTFARLASPDFPLIETIEPTPMDRSKMDRIVKAALSESWIDDLGNKQIIIRGRGGVGKTAILLQLAYRAFDRDQMRSVVLTYNRALVADMRRTMALLGVPRSIEKGGISIDTVHSFVGRVMRALGIIDDNSNFLEQYEDKKDTLVSYIKDGAIKREDIDNLFNDHPDEFFWDAVFVDEGQDWPTNEIEIIRFVFGSNKLVVADGVDQYVRDSVADWSKGVAREIIRPRRLTRCLRMKANLAGFASDLAKELQLPEWDLEANPEANGGRVIVYEGDLVCRPDIYMQLSSEALSLGNYPIDLLACVPPSLVMHSARSQYSKPGEVLTSHGSLVWDGTSVDVRQHFPTDRNALRIVQYDSCRGLEGWTVINYLFDEFWEHKISLSLSDGIVDKDLFLTDREMAVRSASQWCMIPVTRAMDTLVLNLSNKASAIKDALSRIHRRRSDYVEWIKL